MPSKNLLGLGKKPGKGFEQEEVTGNSFSLLLVEEASLASKKSLLEASLDEVEEAFSFQERVFWNLPLLNLKRKELFFPYPHPSNKAMKQLVTYSSKEGCEWRGSS